MHLKYIARPVEPVRASVRICVWYQTAHNNHLDLSCRLCLFLSLTEDNAARYLSTNRRYNLPLAAHPPLPPTPPSSHAPSLIFVTHDITVAMK